MAKQVKAERPMDILRRVWQELGLQGHCYSRRSRGAYRDVWTSTMPNAQHFDDVVYVGACRGAALYY